MHHLFGGTRISALDCYSCERGWEYTSRLPVIVLDGKRTFAAINCLQMYLDGWEYPVYPSQSLDGNKRQFVVINHLQMFYWFFSAINSLQMSHFCSSKSIDSLAPIFHWLVLLLLGSFLFWYILSSKKYTAYISHLIWKLLHMQEICLIGSAQFVVSHHTMLTSPIVF